MAWAWRPLLALVLALVLALAIFAKDEAHPRPHSVAPSKPPLHKLTDPAACVAACLSTSPPWPAVPICASLLERTVLYEPGQYICLFNCNVTALYPGECGCPSECSGHGQCVGNSSCACTSPWAGPDCSLIAPAACVADSRAVCSNAGSCMVSADGFGTCACDAGFTDPLCASPLARFIATPALPPLFTTTYYDDASGDANPLFNRSVVASVRVYVSPHDYEALVAPTHAYGPDTLGKVPGNVSFSSSVLDGWLVGVGVSIKGGWSRMYLKRSFKITTDTFAPGQTFAGQKSFSLKAAVLDPTMMRNVYAYDLNRALGLAFQRVSFAQLWINGINHGFYVIAEEVSTKEYLQSRFPHTASAGLMRSWIHANLAFNGTSPDDYNWPVYWVDRGPITGTLTALAQLAEAINASSDASFTSLVAGRLDVDRFLRYMVVETLLGNPDGYSWRGSNWWLYVDLATAGAVAVVLPYDLEESMGLGAGIASASWAAMTSAEFFVGCAQLPGPPCESHPLSERLFKINATRYYALLEMTVDALFGSTAANEAIYGYAELFQAHVAADPWYALDKAPPLRTAESFGADAVPALLGYMAARAATAMDEVAQFRSASRT